MGKWLSMNKSAVMLKTLLLAAIALSSVLAIAQGSGANKLPDEPKAKTQTPPAASNGPFKDQREKASYALGMNVGNGLRQQSVDIDPTTFAQGFKDALSGGKTLLTEDEAKAALMQLSQEVRAKQQEKRKQAADTNQKEGEAFLAANKTKEGVVTLPSGLQYKILTPGTGPKPAATDTVVCNYKGTFLNGTEFDSSTRQGGPATFEVGRVIKGWTEALQQMPVGSKWQLFIPSTLAYGEQGFRDDIPPNETLIFEVELLSIQPKAPPAPSK